MEYRIHLIQTGGKKIYLEPEGTEGIYLYPGEVRKSRLEDGMLLSEEMLEGLRVRYALPRAKKRAFGLLVKQDKTVHELREKLEQSLNDSRSIQEALQFVIDLGYVNDYGYARDYLHSRRKRKSYRVIRMELLRKGIPPDILESVFEEEGEQERADVEEAVKKYIRRFPEPDRAALEKACAHFYRKGYDAELIRGIVREISGEMNLCDDQ